MSGDDDTPLLEKAMNNWNGFRSFMWNPEEKTVMGRGGRSWAKITLFYFVFYSCLAAFWAAVLGVFLQTISYDRPKWTAYVSTPGLTAVPVPDDQDRIRWTPADSDSVQQVTADIRKLYEGLQQSDAESVDCASMGPGSIDEGPRFCSFNVDVLGNCKPPNFGWDTLKPCLFFRLNRVYNWIPEDYEDGEVPSKIADLYQNGNVAINCNFRRPADEANFNASTPFPSAGIPYGFFPHIMGAYSQDKGRSVQPVVAVQVSIKPNVAVNIKCQAFAGNIEPRKGLFDTDDRSEVSIYLTATVE